MVSRLILILFLSLGTLTSEAIIGGSHGAKAEQLLETLESPYNTIFVYQKKPYITLAFGHKKQRYIESRRNPNDLTALPISYTQSFTIALAYPEKLSSFLMIGMGGGSTSWYVHESLPNAKVTAIELDPEIVRLAEKYYGLKPAPRFNIVTRDGRLHILRDKTKHDCIFIDAYRGPFVPFHLMTKEFFTLVKKRLTKGGVVAQNIEPTTMLYDRTIATLAKVFDQVEVYSAGSNVVAIAYDGKAKPIEAVIKQAEERQAQHKFRYALPELVKTRAMHLDYDAKGPILTDDFAPVNTLKEIKNHNKKRK